MNNQLRIIVAALALVTAGYAGSVAAQDSMTSRTTYVSDAGDVIHCQSTQSRTNSCDHADKPMAGTASPGVVHCVATDSGRTYCGKFPVQYVVKGGGRNPICVEGSTWGTDDRGLWVSGGCAVYFATGAN